MSEEKVIQMDKKTATKKVTATKAKKLTGANISKAIKNIAKRKTVAVTINGEVYKYEIDTEVLPSKRDELANGITDSLAFMTDENSGLYDENELFKKFAEKEIETTIEALMIADIYRIFSDFEVENTIEGKIDFIQNIGDLGIFVELFENLPTTILDTVKEIEDEKVEILNKLSAEADKLKEDYDVLQKQMEAVDKKAKEE